ncbi:hypothetical protein D3C84_668090 [compost metagenome]
MCIGIFIVSLFLNSMPSSSMTCESAPGECSGSGSGKTLGGAKSELVNSQFLMKYVMAPRHVLTALAWGAVFATLDL